MNEVTSFNAEREAYRLLQSGDYRRGWAMFQTRQSRINGPYLRCGLPEWRGEPLRGKHVLLAGEQGLGDEVQFGRFLPRLKALGAHVTAAVLPQNRRLFLQLGADAVVDRLANNPVSGHYVVGLLSLPLMLGLYDEASFGSDPYLTAPAASRGGGVGVVWRGQPLHPNDRNRSMPSPELLLSLPGAVVLEPQGDTIDSLNTLAGLDALVSVDTSWVHLAGSLGVPCHVLLPALGTDWRWGAGRSTSPWYRSLRLYRQPTPGDWGAVVEDARRALGALG